MSRDLGHPMIWQTNVERCASLPRMSQRAFARAFAATGFGERDASLLFDRTAPGRTPEARCDINYKAYMTKCFPGVPLDYVYERDAVVDDGWILVV